MILTPLLSTTTDQVVAPPSSTNIALPHAVVAAALIYHCRTPAVGISGAEQALPRSRATADGIAGTRPRRAAAHDRRLAPGRPQAPEAVNGRLAGSKCCRCACVCDSSVCSGATGCNT